MLHPSFVPPGAPLCVVACVCYAKLHRNVTRHVSHSRRHTPHVHRQTLKHVTGAASTGCGHVQTGHSLGCGPIFNPSRISSAHASLPPLTPSLSRQTVARPQAPHPFPLAPCRHRNVSPPTSHNPPSTSSSPCQHTITPPPPAYTHSHPPPSVYTSRNCSGTASAHRSHPPPHPPLPPASASSRLPLNPPPSSASPISPQRTEDALQNTLEYNAAFVIIIVGIIIIISISIISNNIRRHFPSSVNTPLSAACVAFSTAPST